MGLNIQAFEHNRFYVDKINKPKTSSVKEIGQASYPNTFGTQLVSADQALVYFTANKKLTVEDLVKEIRPLNIRKHLCYLASDELAGRKPDTDGADKAKKYILDQYTKAGLKPFKKLLGKSFVQSALYQTMYHEMDRDPKTNRVEVVKDKDAIKVEGDSLFIQNVIGCIPAKKSTDKYVFIMAHYDHLGRNHDTGQIYNGADDNASGVAVMLEIARVMAQYKYDKNVVFVATSGEETKCMGSRFLMKKMKEAGLTQENVEILNLDCLSAEGDYISIVGKEAPQNSRIEKIAVDMAKQLKVPYDDKQVSRNAHTDAAIFDEKGYPAISLTWAYEECFDNRAHLHKPEDKEEIVNYDGVKKSAKVALATLFEMSKNTN